MSLTPFTKDDIMSLGNKLEDYHTVFYTFWELAGVFYDDQCPTAYVKFCDDGKPIIAVGTEFWTNLTLREKLFVICHECLHVILHHDIRKGDDIKGATPKLVNIAQDIVINELIVDAFGFDRIDIRDWKNLCWIDTCFKYHQLIARNETYSYYLEKLIHEGDTDNAYGSDPQPLDQHGAAPTPGQPSGGTGPSDEILEKILKGADLEVLQKIFESLDDSQKLRGVGNAILAYKLSKESSKIRFTKFVKKLKRNRIKQNEVVKDSFVHIDRRFADVCARHDFMLPGKVDVMRPLKNKILACVFLDVSGSCIHLVKQFNEIMNAFYEEPELFEVRAFIFDTDVREVSRGAHISIGGGTSFDIIEHKIQELKQEYSKYPDGVFVITDGAGNQVAPECPERWIWLLTDHPQMTFINKASSHHKIKDIVF